MSIKNFKLTIDKKNIAILEFSLAASKVNILKSSVLTELSKQLDIIAKNTEIKILLIKSAKVNNFIAGADINEIADINSEAEAIKKVAKGQEILSKIASLSCITLAYINGSCMGGGTELALCCDFRIANDNPKTMLALPEVNLGIIPGFGGTQRLPRLVGLVNSLPMILAGKALNYKKAFKIGLIDGYFPQGYEKIRLAEFLDNLLDDKFRDKLIKKRQNRPFIERISFLHKVIFNKAKQNILKKTAGKYPAPLAALEVVRKTYNISLAQGLEVELQYFADLVTKQICKNLINLYFINEQVRKEFQDAKIAHIKQAGVLGSGVMGGGIAWLYTKLNLPVRMKDVNWQAIALGYQQISKNYQALLKIRKITKAEFTNKFSLVTASTDFSGFKNCDIVSEAVVEDMKIKKQVLGEFEQHIKDDCIIASNTSALSINDMSKALKKPQRFLGVHFFNPVNRMPLVEIIPSEKTSKQVIANSVAIMKKAKKVPIIVKDGAGFLVNRILLNFINEAFYILDECSDIKRIDDLLKDFGMPMGPFSLADTVGLDVGYKVAVSLEKAYGARMKTSPLIDQIYNKHKLLGKKAGKGIYVYKKGKVRVNDQIKPLCKNNKASLSDQDIVDRVILIMVNEAARCIEQKVVASPAHLDLAMIMGTGFPAYRGGLLKYADNRGITEIVKRLKELAKNYGTKFKPCDYLLKLQKEKKEFYS